MREKGSARSAGEGKRGRSASQPSSGGALDPHKIEIKILRSGYRDIDLHKPVDSAALAGRIAVNCPAGREVKIRLCRIAEGEAVRA